MLRWVFTGLMLMLASPVLAQGPNADARLLSAVNSGDLASVQAALRDGARINVRDGQKRTALLLATHRNDIAVAKALIEAGADVNAKDSIEDSPYLYAGAEGRTEILKLTLRAGADLRSTNRYGGTALIPAAHHGHVETVRVLLGTGVDVNHVNKLGWTALMEAVLLGGGDDAHNQIVELLLRGGARPDIADKEGVTPLAHARKRGFGAMVRSLESYGAR